MTATTFCMTLVTAALVIPSGADTLMPNHLIKAKVSGNLDTFGQGVRGEPKAVVYDPLKGEFVAPSTWHEYGVGFGADLGVVPEDQPAWWMAEWAQPVSVNLIALSGVYPNQPQPDTAWKVEIRAEDAWRALQRGVGGWYDTGLFTWGGAKQEPIAIDALRVSVFSKDENTPISSIHFRGEGGTSWIVGLAPPFEAEIVLPKPEIVAGGEATFRADVVEGEIDWWEWRVTEAGLDAPTKATGMELTHTFAEVGEAEVVLLFGAEEYVGEARESIRVASPIQGRIEPLDAPVMAGREAQFHGATILGDATAWAWEFGDGAASESPDASHVFEQPGIYQVVLTVTDGEFQHECRAIVRAHDETTLTLPQVVLDTDQKNEQDDQHYLGYGVFSELDILGVNSVHHGGGQEEINYNEIVYVLDLARQSGLPAVRQPFVFRGADERLRVPVSKVWSDTAYVPTQASEAILAAARGASPSNPVWVVPVGPGTNVATAILQARHEGFDLSDRLRVMWLGGSNDSVSHEFNGDNDPWSMYIVAQSGLETWIMPAPVGARVAIDKRTEADLYGDHPLGRYLLEIVPAANKPLFDPSCLSAIISDHLGLGWVRETQWVTIAGPDEDYRWSVSDGPTSVRVIREIDQEAMKLDIFNSMKGTPTHLTGR